MATEREKLYISRSEKTFQYDKSLPNLPIPRLSSTLAKYLDSVKPHVTDKEFAQTLKIVNDFENGMGKELHAKLMDQAKHSRNWLEKWWEQYAYLAFREPLVPYINIAGTYASGEEDLPALEHKSIKYASLFLHYYMQVFFLVRRSQLKPNKSNKNKPLSMNQFRRLFNTCRIPGKDMDSLVCHFKTEDEGEVPQHIVVLCNGHIFAIEAVTAQGDTLTPPEWESQLRKIREWCLENPEGPGVGTLTCDNRTKWWKNREWLLSLSPKNKETLSLIETSLFALVLENEPASTPGEACRKALGGDVTNRWVDKSTTYHIYQNGQGSLECDHMPFDGLVSIAVSHYIMLSVEQINGAWIGSSSVRELPCPRRLEFVLDPTILSEIKRVNEEARKTCSELMVLREVSHCYGKSIASKHKLHPDTYVQLAMQLAYMRLHGRPAPTYETATTREYYNGRTETVRSCTVEAVTWAKAMLDSQKNNPEKMKLMLIAFAKHNKLMNEAKQNSGCDRHLFGLYCVAAEAGLPIHPLYTDPSWTKSGGGGNFVLSSSLLGYTSVGGLCAPMCTDGYGVFYNICPDRIYVSVTAWRRSKETSTLKYFQALEQSFSDMQAVILSQSSSL